MSPGAPLDTGPPSCRERTVARATSYALSRYALASALALALVLWGTIFANWLVAPVATAAEPLSAVSSTYVYAPRDLPRDTPVQVLVALHGIGGTGEQLAEGLFKEAQRNHWLLVAPTIKYGDWTNADQVATEDPRLIAWLADYLDHLGERVGVPLKPRVLLFGHSRGAQLALRFALFEPQRVLGVAALSAGTYTLPIERDPSSGALIRFPFGLADLATVAGHPFGRVTFIEGPEVWLGVGSQDDNPADLPRAWDQYLGTTRVQRASTFQAALHTLGVQSVMVRFNGEKHALSAAMAASASSFLRAIDLESLAGGPPGTPAPVHAARTRSHF